MTPQCLLHTIILFSARVCVWSNCTGRISQSVWEHFSCLCEVGWSHWFICSITTIDFLTNCMKLPPDVTDPSHRRAHTSPLLCLPQWGQLLSTASLAADEPGSCNWPSPAHYCGQKSYGPREQWSSAPFTVHCCVTDWWLAMPMKYDAKSSSLFICIVDGMSLLAVALS